jgi:hypothetical protein
MSPGTSTVVVLLLTFSVKGMAVTRAKETLTDKENGTFNPGTHSCWAVSPALFRAGRPDFPARRPMEASNTSELNE